MFKILREFGDHKIYEYDQTLFKFREYIECIFNTTQLETLHLSDEHKNIENLHDVETNYHKLFYQSIKSDDTFKMLYCRFIKSFYDNFFPKEKAIIFQAFPSIRIQFKNNIAVPPHCDSDSLGNHPIGEKNFLIPITKMYKSNRLFIESAPNKQDFQGIDLEPGNLFYFNGNKCVHYNQQNIEENIRVSLDFRCILLNHYLEYMNNGKITTTNPRDVEKKRVPTKMIIGGYYQLYFRDQPFDVMLNWHTQKNLLPQSMASFSNEEAVACFNYLATGNNFITEFKQTEILEKIICEYINVKHCIMTTSGTMALMLALMSLNLPINSEIIVPNYTMIATINAIKILGYRPVIIDVHPTTYTISLESIKLAVTKNTSAVLHVSLNNRHHNIKNIVEYCKINNIILVEDAAQSLGCKVNGQHFGTFGEIGCFSLSTPKIISTGQGGFCVTNNSQLAQKMAMIKNFGRKYGGIDDFETFGLNMKFTDIQAVIGIEQMKKLPHRVTRMREIFDLYYKNLNNCVSMIIPNNEEWLPWFVDCFTPYRDELAQWLNKHNIQTRNTYPEINKTPMYYTENIFPVSNYVSTHGLFLPSYSTLKDDEIIHICNLIQLFFIQSKDV